MFHSLGMVQSNTCDPVGTSVVLIGMCRARIDSVSRTPFPVMLRQIGYSSATSACIEAPTEPLSACAAADAESDGHIAGFFIFPLSQVSRVPRQRAAAASTPGSYIATSSDERCDRSDARR